MKLEHPSAYVVAVSIGALILLYTGIPAWILLAGLVFMLCPLLMGFVLIGMRRIGRTDSPSSPEDRRATETENH